MRKRGCRFSCLFVLSEVRVFVFVCKFIVLMCMKINLSDCSRVGVHVSMSTVYVCACAMCV